MMLGGGLLGGLFRLLAQTEAPAAEEPKNGGYDFFSSYESCYALLAEIPQDELLETARGAGIDPEGKSRMELVKELFGGTGPNAGASSDTSAPSGS